MKNAPTPGHYYPGAPVANAPHWGRALAALRHLLDAGSPFPADEFAGLIDELEAEGVLPYAAHQLLSSKATLPEEATRRFRQELLRGAAEKLSDDLELALIFAAASARNLPAVLIKGEAVARTLYPAPSCRPTGDYDLLIRPGDLPAFQELLTGLGYRTSGFHGHHIFAEQDWACPPEVRGRHFLVDLHWDVTNRRFFRQRVDLDKVLQDSMAVPLEDGQCRVPSAAHSLLIACIHLAAAGPAMPVDLRWLLDIRLLLEKLSSAEFEDLVREAKGWGLAGVLAVYCAMADAIVGPAGHAEPIARLYRQIRQRRRTVYRWTCDHRWFDLLEYGIRLRGMREWRGYLSQVLSYRKDWKTRRQR